MLAIHAGGGGNPRRNSNPPTPPKPSLQDRIGDAMKNGTGSYQGINDAFGGYNSPQTKTVYNGPIIPSAKKAVNGPHRYGGSGDSGSSGGSGGPAYVPSTSAKAFSYYESPIAKKYGLSRTTAYQEALANTAYRREMEDMRKAGLNPSVIYGSHNTSGADSSIIPRDDFDYGSYGGSGRSGGSGGSGGRRYRGGNSGKYAFSGGAYYGIMAAVGTIAAVATKNVGAGMAAAGLTGTALKALNGFLKK